MEGWSDHFEDGGSGLTDGWLGLAGWTPRRNYSESVFEHDPEESALAFAQGGFLISWCHEESAAGLLSALLSPLHTVHQVWQSRMHRLFPNRHAIPLGDAAGAYIPRAN